MSDNPRVLKLLEEMLESGQTPEEACTDSPELLPDVREQFSRFRQVAAQIDAMFPPSSDPMSLGPRGRAERSSAVVPEIPGYEIEHILGRGGMGVVYKARQLSLNRPVALKMLLSGVYASPAELSRFIREAHAIAGLQHANIVQVHDIGELNGCPYFTMELMAGGNLGQRLAGVPQPAREAATLAATLASAIAAAHQAGIIHRDMKPANVLIASDGTLKIADFGLANQIEAEPGITLDGARIGTPSYMAPEQAMGRLSRIGPAADIYALGAILYEMLTGRPPFRGESASETERQLLTEEPVPPTRLNARVPRDLETICLKCLHKDPQKRYATATVLGDDLARFLAGTPISARPAGMLERGVKWARRRPTYATAIAGAALVACVLVGSGVWVTLLRADQRNAVEVDLRDVAQFQAQARWLAARAALDHAEARLGPNGPAYLRDRFRSARRDLDLVIKLDGIRLTRTTRGEPLIYKLRASRAYEDAFSGAGLMQPGDSAARVAGRIRESAVRAALVEALEDWIICASATDQRNRLMEIAIRAQPDAQGWPARVLDCKEWGNRAAVDQLIREAPIDREPLSLLLVLAERLKAAGGEPSDFVKRVQSEHPTDFWANLLVGNDVMFRAPKATQTYESFPIEAIGYYRAALASRPDAAVGYCVVGDALRMQSAFDAAMEYYQKALAKEPQYARAYTNIGLTFQGEGKLDLAIENYRKAILLDPDYAWTYFELANALRTTGQLQEAEADYRKAMALDPSITRAMLGLQSVLMREGRSREVQAAWKAALAADPQQVDDWIGYAQLSLFVGDEGEYARARRQLFDRFSATADPSICERLSRACLLMPLTGDDLQKAVAMADCAVEAKSQTDPREYPYHLFARGLADYRAGQFAEAIEMLKRTSGVTGPGPRLVMAMAQHRLGNEQAARASLAVAIAHFDWTAADADWRDPWIWHVLRREAETMILPHLEEFRAGTYWPQDNDERLALIGLCQFEGFYDRAARLYAEAFTADSELAGSAGADHRFMAARFAALAGCGLGQEAGHLSEADRARWRAQAQSWLDADLMDCEEQLADAASATKSVRERLTRWTRSPELAPLREPAALSSLPPAECKQWTDFWTRVHTILDRTSHPS